MSWTGIEFEFDTVEVSKIWRAKKFTVLSAALTIWPEDGDIYKCLLLVYHDGKKDPTRS